MSGDEMRGRERDRRKLGFDGASTFLPRETARDSGSVIQASAGRIEYLAGGEEYTGEEFEVVD
jgi:hypothetical protein